MKPGHMFSVFNGNDSVGFILDVTVFEVHASRLLGDYFFISTRPTGSTCLRSER